MAPVINRWIGAMKLVSSAVWLHLIEQRCRESAVRTLKGGFPRRERPWAAWSLPGGPGRGGSSRAPSAKTKKQATCNIPNPQGPAAQKKEYNKNAYPQQVRTFYVETQTCRKRVRYLPAYHSFRLSRYGSTSAENTGRIVTEQANSVSSNRYSSASCGPQEFDPMPD